MENAIIEAAARAACRHVEISEEKPGEQPPWAFLGYASRDAWVDDCWPNYVGQVRAAIEAMREPTEAQYEALSATDKLWRELDSRTVWQTYIDAALKVQA